MSIAEKLTTIAENQEKVFEAGKNAVVNELKEAQKGTASGEVISLTDISPIEHNLGVKLSSKNLIPYPYENTTKTMNGITFTDNGDGSITIKGKKEDTNASSYFILCRGIDFGDTTFGGGSDWSKTSHTNGTYTIGKGMFYNSNSKALSVNIPSNVEVNETLYPMLEKGTKATAYTPYVDDVSTTTLNALGKNLFNNDTDLIEQQTFHNSSGTEYKRYGYKPLLLPKGTYTFSANLINTQAEGVHLYVYKVNANDILVGSAIYIANGTTLYTPTFTMDNGEKIIICNGDGASSINKTKQWFGWFNIQLEAGNGATPYEPYCPTSYQPMADGTVEGVKSIFPSTTLMTDKQGVLIECEYIKDLNAVVGELTDAIISLGGDI